MGRPGNQEEDIMRNTYNHQYAAHLMYADGRTRIVIVPDHVGQDQMAWGGRTFRVQSGQRVRLDGDAYDLRGTGTGDMVVRPE